MKKIALVSVLAAAVAMPAFAAEEMHAPAAAMPVATAPAAAIAPATTTTTTTTATTPAPAAAMPAAGSKKVELKDGSWAQVTGEAVTVSKDGGKTWMPATDGTWEAKDGSKIMTKGGMIAK